MARSSPYWKDGGRASRGHLSINLDDASYLRRCAPSSTSSNRRLRNPYLATCGNAPRDQTECVHGYTTSTLLWVRFIDVLERPEFSMMFLTRSQFITLPVADLSEEALAFLRSRLPRKSLIPVKHRAIPPGLGTRGRHRLQTDGGWRGQRRDT